MTYRVIFLQVDPHYVGEALGLCEVEINGRKARFRSERAFDICKGLKFFAQGEKYDEPETVAIAKTLEANPLLTDIQARVLVTGLKGYLQSVVDAMFIDRMQNPDEIIASVLDQKFEIESDINHAAIEIIKNILKGQI